MSIVFFEIIGFGIAYPLFMLFLQRRITDMDKMYDMQDSMNEKQKRQTAIQKALIQKRKEHLTLKSKEGVMPWEIKKFEEELAGMENSAKDEMQKLQKEMMDAMPQMLKNNLKSLVFLSALSLVIYYVFFPWAFAGAASGMTFTIASFNLNYKSLFFWTAIISGLSISLIVTSHDKKRRKRQKAQQNNQQ